MSDIEAHDFEWNDRLQDLLDGCAEGAERSSIEAHVGSCARCRAQYARLKKLDAMLQARVDRPSPTPAFDQQVFARINAFDARARETARRKVDRELKDNLEALASGWRRKLIATLGGAIGGVALALALMTWTDETGIASALVAFVSESVGSSHAGTLHLLMTLGIGAAIGAAVSRWVTTTVD